MGERKGGGEVYPFPVASSAMWALLGREERVTGWIR